jgi:acetyl esterase/lipase
MSAAAAVAEAAAQPPTVPMAYPIDIERKSPQRPLTTRIRYWTSLWAFKTVVAAYILNKTHISGQKREIQPTYTKSYPSRPHLTARVFIPKSYKPDDAPLPLLIDVHGGGFAIGAPLIDDEANAALAHEHGFVVVSIGYRLAPSYPFPTAVEDVADQIKDVLDDKDLPVDGKRIALIGYSAGGNLVLSAPQMHRLSDRIPAAVAYYPVVDFVVTTEERNKHRTEHPHGRTDNLAESSKWFNWGYIDPGTPLRDPRLSPRFAERERLPKYLYILGCEYDMLCHEAWVMSEELAVKEGTEKKEDTKDGNPGFECGNIRWKKIQGVEHGFNAIAERKTGDERKLYLDKTQSTMKDVVEWLHRVAWKDIA